MNRQDLYNPQRQSPLRGGEPLLTTAELATKFGVSSHTLAGLMRSHPEKAPTPFPWRNVCSGRVRYFRLSEARRWAAHNQIDFSRYAK